MKTDKTGHRVKKQCYYCHMVDWKGLQVMWETWEKIRMFGNLVMVDCLLLEAVVGGGAHEFHCSSFCISFHFLMNSFLVHLRCAASEDECAEKSIQHFEILSCCFEVCQLS